MNKGRKFFKNILLVSGTGRNCGKTTLICQLLKKLSPQYSIVALKISPHRHELDNDVHYLLNSSTIQLVKEESTVRAKDSARMLLAGADEVFYIQAEDQYLSEAFGFIEPFIHDRLVVCESAALNRIIRPSCHIVVTRNEMIMGQLVCDVVVDNQNNNFTMLIDRINVRNSSWLIV